MLDIASCLPTFSSTARDQGRRDMHKSAIELERLAYSVTDAAAIIGISRHLLYDAIRNGEITPKRCGARTLITADRLRAYLDGLPDGIEPSRSPNARGRRSA